MVKPNFLCIGVQKSGTTSLIEYLNQNPDIFMSKVEKHFFDRRLSEGVLMEKDYRLYESQFQTDRLIVGEKTPSYCYLRYAIDRIYSYNPGMKLLLFLREPISRAFSEFNMKLNYWNKSLNDVTDEEIINFFKREETLSLRYIESNDGYYIVRGYYDEIIEYIFSKFPKENLYIGISEEMRENKLDSYNKIYCFLGARPLDKIDETVDTYIGHYSREIPMELLRRLYDIYRPHTDRLYRLLNRDCIEKWEDYYRSMGLK